MAKFSHLFKIAGLCHNSYSHSWHLNLLQKSYIVYLLLSHHPKMRLHIQDFETQPAGAFQN